MGWTLQGSKEVGSGPQTPLTLLAQRASGFEARSMETVTILHSHRVTVAFLMTECWYSSMRPHQPLTSCVNAANIAASFHNMWAPTEWRIVPSTSQTISSDCGSLLRFLLRQNWCEGTSVDCKLPLTWQRGEHTSKRVWKRGNRLRSLAMESDSTDDAAKSLQSPTTNLAFSVLSVKSNTDFYHR